MKKVRANIMALGLVSVFAMGFGFAVQADVDSEGVLTTETSSALDMTNASLEIMR